MPSNGYENIVCHAGIHRTSKVIQRQAICSVVKQDVFSKASTPICINRSAGTNVGAAVLQTLQCLVSCTRSYSTLQTRKTPHMVNFSLSTDF